MIKLFSNSRTCVPCQRLKMALDQEFPEWQDHIEYYDAPTMTQEDFSFASSLGIKKVPAVTDEVKVLFTGFNSDTIDNIKKLVNVEV